MANKTLFKTQGFKNRIPATDTTNEAGGRAYKMSSEHALAQYLVTGCFNNTFYASAEEQLDKVTQLLGECSPEFIAKAAVYAHKVAHMKDMPCYALAYLGTHGRIDMLQALASHNDRTDKVFNHVMTNGKMLSNFVQMIRSGSLGRRSLGHGMKRLIQNWIRSKDALKLWQTSIGVADPSIADVLHLCHVRPANFMQENIHNYILGREFQLGMLPIELQQFEALKRGDCSVIPNIPFRCLTNVLISEAGWRQIAMNMPWSTLRQNLNMLDKRKVFADKKVLESLAAKLANPDEVRKNNAFPYQLLTTYQNTTDIPMLLRLALQDAMEVATKNVPAFNGNTAVLVDVSGSMQTAVTGFRPGATSVTKCVDVAALVASCVLRTNPSATIVQFDTSARALKLNPRDSVMTNAQHIACSGGGTDVGCGLAYVLQHCKPIDNVIIVSDNESWYNGSYRSYYGSGTSSQGKWAEIRQRNPHAKLVNIDILANSSVQLKDTRREVLNIAGFSDAVWPVIDRFLTHDSDESFIKDIENSVKLL